MPPVCVGHTHDIERAAVPRRRQRREPAPRRPDSEGHVVREGLCGRVRPRVGRADGAAGRQQGGDGRLSRDLGRRDLARGRKRHGCQLLDDSVGDAPRNRSAQPVAQQCRRRRGRVADETRAREAQRDDELVAVEGQVVDFESDVEAWLGGGCRPK